MTRAQTELPQATRKDTMLSRTKLHPPRRPLVFGHGGAPVDAPTHTRAAFLRAIEGGADWITAGAVLSRDGVLFAAPRRNITRWTDVRRHREIRPRLTRDG